jgi:undecaprenyl diphosphate synthase
VTGLVPPVPAVPAVPPDDRLGRIRLESRIPRHVAIIMDGNGRWAAGRGRSRVFGHRAGMIAAGRAVDAALEAGVQVLTLFALSDENWRRPTIEVSALLSGLELQLRRGVHAGLRRKGVAVRVLGRLDRLPPRQRIAIARVVEETRGGTRLQLNVALSYGGRSEIVRAARRLAEQVERGTLTAAEIDEALLAANLDTVGLPDPDLLIRTSGELRVSNFLLWQIAYAELHFSAVLWPEFTQRDFYEAIDSYQSRQRRYGGIEPAGDAAC